MNRKELVRIVADKVGLTQEEVRAVLLETMREVAEGLRAAERVELRSFGIFEVRQRAARTGRDPRDGSPILIPPRKVVAFRSAPGLEKFVFTPPGVRPRRWLV